MSLKVFEKVTRRETSIISWILKQTPLRGSCFSYFYIHLSFMKTAPEKHFECTVFHIFLHCMSVFRHQVRKLQMQSSCSPFKVKTSRKQLQEELILHSCPLEFYSAAHLVDSDVSAVKLMTMRLSPEKRFYIKQKPLELEELSKF